MDETIVRPIVTTFGHGDFRVCEDLNSPYMRFFLNYGDDINDTRRMSVLEGIPLYRCDELDVFIEHLCEFLGGDPLSIVAVKEWIEACKSVRNRVPEVPRKFADEVFDVYKHAILKPSYYFSIVELLLHDALTCVPLLIAVFDRYELQLLGASFSGGVPGDVFFFVCATMEMAASVVASSGCGRKLISIIIWLRIVIASDNAVRMHSRKSVSASAWPQKIVRTMEIREKSLRSLLTGAIRRATVGVLVISFQMMKMCLRCAKLIAMICPRRTRVSFLEKRRSRGERQ